MVKCVFYQNLGLLGLRGGLLYADVILHDIGFYVLCAFCDSDDIKRVDKQSNMKDRIVNVRNFPHRMQLQNTLKYKKKHDIIV